MKYYELFKAWCKYRSGDFNEYEAWYNSLSVEEMQLIPLLRFVWDAGYDEGRHST